MQNYNFVCGFVWVQNLVSEIKGATHKRLHKYCEKYKKLKRAAIHLHISEAVLEKYMHLNPLALCDEMGRECSMNEGEAECI
jgi:hypothetical protein